MLKEVEAQYLGSKAKCYGLPKESDAHRFIDWENGNHESSRCVFCGLSQEIDMSIHYGQDY